MGSEVRRASIPVAMLLAATASLPASAAPQFQQSFDQSFSSGGGASNDGGYAVQPLSAGSPVQVGDFIYVALSIQPVTANIDSVEDSLGNVYRQAFSLTEGFPGWRFGTYWTIARSSGDLTVNFNIQHFDLLQVHGLSYSGVRPLDPIDPSGSNGDTATTAMSCTLQTQAQGEVLLAFMPSAGHATGFGSGETVRSQLDGDAVIERLVDSPGTYTVTATTTQAPWYAQCLGLFASPLATSVDAGLGGQGDGGAGDGGSSAGGDAGTLADGGTAAATAARLSSDLGCSSSSGLLWPAGGLLLIVAGRGWRARRRHP